MCLSIKLSQKLTSFLILLSFLFLSVLLLSFFLDLLTSFLTILFALALIVLGDFIRQFTRVFKSRGELNLKLVHILCGLLLSFISLQNLRAGIGITVTSLVVYLLYCILYHRIKSKMPFSQLFETLGLDSKIKTNVVSALCSISLTLILFKQYVSFLALVSFSLGDGFSGMFGRLFGKNKLPYNHRKTFEGTFFEFILLYLLFLLTLNEPIEGLLVALAISFMETLPLPFNDNLIYPLFSGLILSFFVRS